MVKLYDGGILRFGIPPPDWDGYVGGSVNWAGQGVLDADAVAFEQLGGYIPGGPQFHGSWLVLRDDPQHPEQTSARVVDSPLFDSVQDQSVVRLTAMPDHWIAVQSRPILLNPTGRDSVTGD